jgi:hypothetical protein
MLTRPFAIAALLALPATTWAQVGSVGPAPDSGGWMGAVIALVLVACVCVVSLKSSKRGHQD